MHVFSQGDLISIAQFDLDQHQNISSPQTECNSLLSLCPYIKHNEPAQKHSEPQPSHLESGHPANHLEAASPDSMMLPVPPLIPPQTPDDTISGSVKPQMQQYLPGSMLVGDARAAPHPVPGDLFGGMYTYSPGLPAALLGGSASPRSVSSANLRTVGFGQMTTSNTLTKRDTTLGSLTSIEPSTGSLALFDPIQVLTKQLDAMHKQGILLRGRYRILGSSEQCSGSQGVVRFASLAVNSSKQLAVKFFLERHYFEVEQALYGNQGCTNSTI
jgi:hypothetical protein